MSVRKLLESIRPPGASSQIESDIVAAVERCADHKLFLEAYSKRDLQRFMEYHVWCVWDFMSLAKSAQVGLGCYTVPWLPPKDANALRLINDILSGEETDENPGGGYSSHFEIYLDAMDQSGASLSDINLFLLELRESGNLDLAFRKANVNEGSEAFVRSTLEQAGASVHVVVAVLCLSREELVPLLLNVLQPCIDDYREEFNLLSWYLERHIDLDTKLHGPLSMKLLKRVISARTDIWEECLTAVLKSVNMRADYLDYIYTDIFN